MLVEETEFGRLYNFHNEIGYEGPTWDELIGIQRAKLRFSQIVKITDHYTKFEQARIPFRPSILLSGPPGTGKTTLVLALAQKEKVPTVLLLPSKIIKSKLGESAQNLAASIQHVKELSKENKKVLLFLDEFDSFARNRADSQEIGEIKRLVNTLLTQLDLLIAENKNVIIVAATNHIHLLDPAVHRRFLVTIEFNPLDEEAMVELWSSYYDRIKMVVDEVSWEINDLVKAMNELTPADIERVVQNAMIEYLSNTETKFDTELLLKQKEYVNPSGKPLTIYGKIATQFDTEQYRLNLITEPYYRSKENSK